MNKERPLLTTSSFIVNNVSNMQRPIRGFPFFSMQNGQEYSTER